MLWTHPTPDLVIFAPRQHTSQHPSSAFSRAAVQALGGGWSGLAREDPELLGLLRNWSCLARAGYSYRDRLPQVLIHPQLKPEIV